MIDGLKPYPAMKDSGVPWLGEVPEHWECAAVRRFSRVFAGATPSRAVPDYWNGGTIPWLASGDVNLRRITGARQFITEAGFAASSTKWIQPGSLVLALAGQGRTKGMVATVECRTTCNQSLAAIEPSPRISNHHFLAYYLESRYLDLRALVGDGLRDGLNLEHVRAIPTPLPPLPEQAAIVRFLDHADRRIRRYIRAKQKLIKLLEEQKQAIIHLAVTRGLDPNVRLKPSGVEWLGEVPEHWDVVPVKRIGSVRIGLTFSPGDVCGEGGTLVLRASNVSNGRVVHADNVRVSKRIPTTLRVREGDILVCVRSGSRSLVGKSALITKEFEGASYGAFMSLLRTMDNRFYFRVLHSNLLPTVMAQFETSTINQLTQNDLRSLVVPVPPETERAAITEFLDSETTRADGAIAAATAEIHLLREYRTRLIADVVTGKRDVREAAARLPQEPEDLEPLDEAEALGDAEDESAADDLDATPEEIET